MSDVAVNLMQVEEVGLDELIAETELENFKPRLFKLAEKIKNEGMPPQSQNKDPIDWGIRVFFIYPKIMMMNLNEIIFNGLIAEKDKSSQAMTIWNASNDFLNRFFEEYLSQIESRLENNKHIPDPAAVNDIDFLFGGISSFYVELISATFSEEITTIVTSILEDLKNDIIEYLKIPNGEADGQMDN